jgi:hypothetical protein
VIGFAAVVLRTERKLRRISARQRCSISSTLVQAPPKTHLLSLQPLQARWLWPRQIRGFGFILFEDDA